MYRSAGRYNEAEPLLKSALSTAEKQDGEIPSTVINVAMLYVATRRYGQAESFWECAVTLAEAAAGENHPWTESLTIELARACEAQGKHEKPEPLCHRALESLGNAVGDESPVLVKGLETLATVCKNTGREVEAAKLTQRVASIRAHKA